MEKTKLRKIGTSLGIIIPATIIEKHGIKEGDEISLFEEEGGIKIMTANEDFKETIRIAEQVMDRYKEALQELANETE